MNITDPIADLLTRIRNAGMVRKRSVRVPASKLKKEILRVMKDEGYILEFEPIDGTGHEELLVWLKYHQDEHVITGMERISRPGRRWYAGAEDIPEILNGFGIAVVTTSRGVMTGRQARESGVGGEVLCKVW